jgi:hypothetical protein
MAVLQSPVLFNLYLDEAVRRWKSQLIILNFPCQFWERNFMTTLMFADDQVVMTQYRGPLQAVQHNK